MDRVVTNMKGRAVPMGDWLSKAVEVRVRNLAGPGTSGRKSGKRKHPARQSLDLALPGAFPFLSL